MSEEIATALGGHMWSLEELAASRLELINRVQALESALEKAEKALDFTMFCKENPYPHCPGCRRIAQEALSEIRRVGEGKNV